MAYLDLTATSATAMMPSSRIAREVVVDRLTSAERDVLRFAVREPLSSTKPVTAAKRWGHKVFGLRRINPLADSRLEALRRYTILVAHGQGSERDGIDLGDAGFSARQIREADAMIQRLAPAPSFRMSAILATLTTMLVALGAYMWVKSRLGDSTIAAILVVTLGLPLVVSVAPRSR